MHRGKKRMHVVFAYNIARERAQSGNTTRVHAAPFGPGRLHVTS